MDHHRCHGEAPYPGQFVFTCCECDYKVVLTGAPLVRTVISQGDPAALHGGSTGEIDLSVEVLP